MSDHAEMRLVISPLESVKYWKGNKSIADRAGMYEEDAGHSSIQALACARSSGVLILKNERNCGSTAWNAGSGRR